MVLFTNVTDTKRTHSIDFQSYPVSQNRVYFIAKGQVHQWHLEKYTNEFQGYLIVFNESFVQADKVLLDLFDFLNNEPFLDLSDENMKIALQLIGLIEQDKESSNKAYPKSLIEALLHFLSDKKEKFNIGMSINQKRFITLRALIEKNYKNEKHVSFYAKKMDMSVKRLTEVVKSLSSFSITALIHQRVLLESKRELSLGDKSIHEIADILGYHDASYFSRFFKKQEGVSPSKFMENNPSK